MSKKNSVSVSFKNLLFPEGQVRENGTAWIKYLRYLFIRDTDTGHKVKMTTSLL